MKRLVQLIALGVAAAFTGCAALEPGDVCPDLSGRYLDRGDDGAAANEFVKFLFEKPLHSASETLLRSTSDGLDLQRGGSTVALRLGQDFTCGSREVRLARTLVSRVRLPPLIDQTTTKSFVMKPTASGEIRVEIYTQTVTAPYGISLTGPKKHEASFE